MKTRNGFVSNSSSSSFIVKNYERFAFADRDNTPNLSKEDIALLEDYGFFRIDRSYASELESNHGIVELSTEDYTFGYYVICNEDEVIEFLLKNNIPFTAATQYGHMHLFYDKDDDHLLVAHNYGLTLEMYGHKREYDDDFPRTGLVEAVRWVKVSEYLDGADYTDDSRSLEDIENVNE